MAAGAKSAQDMSAALLPFGLAAERAELEAMCRKVLRPEESRLLRPLRLQRFLEGHGQDPQQAFKAFSAMVEWTRSMEWEKYCTRFSDKPWDENIVWPELRQFLELSGQHMWTLTPDGHMLVTSVEGAVDYVLAKEILTEEAALETMREVMELRQEYIDKWSLERGYLVKVITVKDWTGFSVRKALKDQFLRQIMKKCIKEGQTCYPESMHRVVMLNTPPAFRVIFRMLAAFVEERSLRKFMILDSEFHDPTAEAIGKPGMETLAKLSMEAHAAEDAPALELPAGEHIYCAFPVTAGSTVDWSFEVSPPGAPAVQMVRFFPDRGGGWLGNHRVVVGAEPLSSKSGGKYTATADGLLWLEWSHPRRIGATVRLENLRLPTGPVQPKQSFEQRLEAYAAAGVSAGSLARARPVVKPPRSNLVRSLVWHLLPVLFTLVLACKLAEWAVSLDVAQS